MADKSVEAKRDLDKFFHDLSELGMWFEKWVGKAPTKVHINPDIVARLSRVEGFYQRPELGTEVSAHAPVVRYFNLKFGVVMIMDDFSEPFLHFE